MRRYSILTFRHPPDLDRISQWITGHAAEFALGDGEWPTPDLTQMQKGNLPLVKVDPKRVYVEPSRVKATLNPPPNVTPPVGHGLQTSSPIDAVSNDLEKIISDEVLDMDNVKVKKESEVLDLPEPLLSQSVKRKIECVIPESVPSLSRGNGPSSMTMEKPNMAQPEGKFAITPEQSQDFFQRISVGYFDQGGVTTKLFGEVIYIPSINKVVQLAEGETQILRLEKLLGRDPKVATPPANPRDHPAVGKIVLSRTDLNFRGVANANQKLKEHNKSRSLGPVLPIITMNKGDYKISLLAVHTALLRPEAKPALNSLDWVEIGKFCASQLVFPYQVEMYEERADLDIPRQNAPVVEVKHL